MEIMCTLQGPLLTWSSVCSTSRWTLIYLCSKNFPHGLAVDHKLAPAKIARLHSIWSCAHKAPLEEGQGRADPCMHISPRNLCLGLI